MKVSFTRISQNLIKVGRDSKTMNKIHKVRVEVKRI